MTANVRSAPGVRGYLPELAIAVAAFLYGVTFSIVQDALDDTTPMGFNLMRFAIGARGARAVRVAAPLGRARGGCRPTPFRTFLLGGASLGVIAAFAYLFQNVGLQHTTTSNSAFITGLFAVFTPIVEAIVYRRFPRTGIVPRGRHLDRRPVPAHRRRAVDELRRRGHARWPRSCSAAGTSASGVLANRFDIFGLTDGPARGGRARLRSRSSIVDGLGHRRRRGRSSRCVFTGIGCSAVALQPLGLGPADDRRRRGPAS